MALSLAIGVGVTVYPYAFIDMRGSQYTANFWRCADCSPALQGLRNGVAIFLSTGYCVGTVIAMILNAIIPADTAVIKAGDKLDDPDQTEDVTDSKKYAAGAEVDPEEVDPEKVEAPIYAEDEGSQAEEA